MSWSLCTLGMCLQDWPPVEGSPLHLPGVMRSTRSALPRPRLPPLPPRLWMPAADTISCWWSSTCSRQVATVVSSSELAAASSQAAVPADAMLKPHVLPLVNNSRPYLAVAG